MEHDAALSQLTLIQHRALLDARLLIAAREHVGAAGIEQMAALERLIAAGQEHTSVARAASQVLHLLQTQTPDALAVQTLLRQSEEQVVWLNELAAVVTTSLQQITATPVQRISAAVLEDIATRMQRQIAALNTLIAAAQASPAVPDAATPTLEAIRATLQADLAAAAQAERQGHLATLLQLALQTCADIGGLTGSAVPERVAALQSIAAAVQQQIEQLTPRA